MIPVAQIDWKRKKTVRKKEDPENREERKGANQLLNETNPKKGKTP
jgi:hypothetical protein